VVLSPQGRVFDQAVAREYRALPGLGLVAGRYEGMDERLIRMEADEELTVGDYVLSGGELPAMLVVDAVARLVPGVLGDEASAEQDSFRTGCWIARTTRGRKWSRDAGAAGAAVGRPRGHPALAAEAVAGADMDEAAGLLAGRDCPPRSGSSWTNTSPSGQTDGAD
jgi:hypothetical protein